MAVTTLLSIIVIAEPGFLRDGILTILGACDSIRKIEVCSVQQYLENIGVYHPDIFLLDCSTEKELCETIEVTRRCHPEGILIIVSDPVWNCPASKENVADLVLTRGFTGQELYSSLQEIVARRSAVANMAASSASETLALDDEYERY